MSQKKFLAITLGCLMLAGCNYAPIETDPVLPVYNTGFDTSRVVSNQNLTVRTFVRDADDKRVEVAGASCRATSREMSAEFISPSILVVPEIKSAPSNLIIQCTDGTRLAQQTVVPSLIDDTYAYIGNLAADLFVSVVSASIQAAVDNWSYVHSGSLVNIDLQ